MTKRDPLVHIEDMIASIDKVLSYLDTVDGLSGFLANDMVIDAVTRNYEIIGEAAKKVSVELKDKYTEIPWKQMYGLRNFAIHEYHIVDPTLLWEIAQNELIQNKIDLERILDQE